MLRLVACACACALLCAGAGAEIVVYTQQVPRTIAEEFRDMPASFGSDLPGDGLRGFLVRGNPPDGCSAMEKPPVDTENFTGKWIVLIARYNCSFEVKVRNAQAAGFDCAIVHNVNSSELETMSAKDPDGIVIPSVFVSDLAGLILAEEYLYTSGFYIMVNGDLPFNINTHLLLPFAIVVVLCLIVILIFMIVKCIKDRRRARRHRLPNRCLRKIPTCKFSKGDPYDTCAICLDDYQEGERLRVLPCAHAYHAKCIDPWLTQNRRVCPVCKRRVLAAGERDRGHSDSDEEPLLGAGAGAPGAGAGAPGVGGPRATQGGTFEEQSENPFRRAARLMSRLRGRQPQEVTSPLDEEAVEENVEEDDRAPLVQSAPAAVHSQPAEQAGRGQAGQGGQAGRRRGQGRARRSRSARHAAAPAPAPAPAPAAPAPAPAAPAVSINSDAGEIGVAALPAAAVQPAAAPHLRV